MFDWRRAGSWCGLAAPSVFIMLWLVAIASTPGYRVFQQWVSDLGVGGGAIYFNSGVIVAGILTIPFAATMALVLRPSRLGIVGSALLVVAAIFLIAIGVFTEDAGSLHWIVSVSFFLSVLLALMTLAWPLYRSPTIASWTGLLTVALVIVGVLMTAVFSTGPVTETTVVLIVCVWSIVVAWKLRVYLCVTLRRPGVKPEPS